jgi:hypothetical protein
MIMGGERIVLRREGWFVDMRVGECARNVQRGDELKC